MLIRRVRSIEELGVLFDAVASLFQPPLARDRRFDQVADHWDSAQRLSLCLVDDDAVVGGVLAFGSDGVVTIRAIAVPDRARGFGVGRRLVELVELEAMAGPYRTITLGAVTEARGFYEALGFRGKRTARSKDLPPPGRLRVRRVAALRSALGDPDAGVPIGAPTDQAPGSRATAPPG